MLVSLPFCLSNFIFVTKICSTPVNVKIKKNNWRHIRIAETTMLIDILIDTFDDKYRMNLYFILKEIFEKYFTESVKTTIKKCIFIINH